MVDGSGVGVVVEFSTNQLTTWFFEDELEAV
ncbi:MAG: cytochrome b6f subunit family protein [Synechococcales cyanobacterium]